MFTDMIFHCTLLWVAYMSEKRKFLPASGGPMTIPGKQAKLAIPNRYTKNIRRGKENTKYHRISIKKSKEWNNGDIMLIAPLRI